VVVRAKTLFCFVVLLFLVASVQGQTSKKDQPKEKDRGCPEEVFQHSGIRQQAQTHQSGVCLSRQI